ncbi:MAG: nucleotide sugar dehydrogenase [Actinomycetota bacterium]|nr:nucleotide sugar dehydrogenase [Actinomycetota bacterium]
MKVAVFGLGYVGTVTAACLASNGHEVWGVDPEKAKVDMVANGTSPVIEPELGRLVAQGVEAGSLHATTNPAEAVDQADVSLVCVGTPSSPQGSTDLSYIARAVKEIGQALGSRRGDAESFHTVVIRSTVPPGTVDGLVAPTLETELGRPVGDGFGVAMCPEFLREGSGVADFFDPPFTVIGTTDSRVVDTLGRLFGFLDRPLRAVPLSTAEALKYACNAFHAVKVSFTNELARLYRPLGVDASLVMELFCEDDRLNISPKYLRPGFAYGGSCLPKDLRSLLYLGRVNSVELPLLVATATSNELTIRDIVQRVLATGRRKVALLGLSFKTQTDDLRESPNVELAETLMGKGCELRIYDPIVEPSLLFGTNLRYVESKLPHLQRLLATSPDDALEGAEVAIVSSNSGDVSRAVLEASPAVVIDLTGHLRDELQTLPGYEGAGW